MKNNQKQKLYIQLLHPASDGLELLPLSLAD